MLMTAKRHLAAFYTTSLIMEREVKVMREISKRHMSGLRNSLPCISAINRTFAPATTRQQTALTRMARHNVVLITIKHPN